MNYLKQVPFWKILILNFILGLLAPLPILAGLLGIFGVFGEPSTQEKITGVAILTACFIAFFVANLLLWKFGKGKVTRTSFEVTVLKGIGMIVVLFGTSFLVFGLLYLSNT